MVLMMSLRSPSSLSVSSALAVSAHHPWSKKAVAFQPSRPVDQEMAVGADGEDVAGIRPKVDEALLPLLGDQHPEPGQALGVHLTRQLAGHIQFGLRSQFERWASGLLRSQKRSITKCTPVLSNIVHTGLLGGQKKQLQPKHVWSVRVWFDPVNRKMAQALLETLR
jgi:hypothetical protein